MRVPTTKSLLRAFRDLTPRKANLIRRLAHATDRPAELERLIETSPLLPRTRRYLHSLHSSPFSSHMWRVTMVLYGADELLETHGVEPLGPVATSGPPYEYLNTGETYSTTLIYRKKTDNLFIGDWGSIAERHPRW